jgi:hypothetical protein
MSNSPNKPDPNSSNTPDPNSSNTPDPNSSNTPDPNSSNTPDPNSSNPGNNFSNLFSNIFSNSPLIANSLICLIVLLSTGNLYQIFISNKISDLTYQNKLCEENKKLVEKDLKIKQQTSFKSLESKVIFENKNIEFLPFHCEYLIELENDKLSQEIYLRASPVFKKYIKENYKNNGTEMDMNDVCLHPSIQDQMKKDAIKNNSYDEKKHSLKPGKPEILTDKSNAYPVHRWVCHYSIEDKAKNSEFSSLSSERDFNIDLNLQPYCQLKAKQENKKFTVPHYRDYDNPYSFYCTDPYSRS